MWCPELHCNMKAQLPSCGTVLGHLPPAACRCTGATLAHCSLDQFIAQFIAHVSRLLLASSTLPSAWQINACSGVPYIWHTGCAYSQEHCFCSPDCSMAYASMLPCLPCVPGPIVL